MSYTTAMIMTGVFMFNFIAATSMIHVVITKLGKVEWKFRWWAIECLTLESIAALLSFMVIATPDDRFLGGSVSSWVTVAYAFANAQIFAWVVLFHISTKRWET